MIRSLNEFETNHLSHEPTQLDFKGYKIPAY